MSPPIFYLAVEPAAGGSAVASGGAGVTYLNGPAIFMSQLKTLAFAQFSVYDLSVVPMFVLMGNIATRAGLSRDLFAAANAWFGHMRGGIAKAAIAACVGFGAVCGSSLATASTMGLITPPVGLNVFVINAMSPDTPLSATFRGVMPFFVAELVRIVLLIAFPSIILFVPRLLN